MNKNFIDVIVDGNEIIIWERNEKGKLYRKRLPISSYLNCYMLSNEETGITDIYGRPVKEVRFSSKYSMREFTKTRDDLFESDVRPEYKVIEDLYHDEDLLTPVNIMYYDIENDFDLSDGLGYPNPQNPDKSSAPINSFQFYVAGFGYGIIHTCGDEFDHPVATDGETVTIIDAEDEAELLVMVGGILDELDVDIFCGWNTNGYDIHMLYERACIIHSEEFAKKFMCRDAYPLDIRHHIDPFGNQTRSFTIKGRHHVDMLEIFKKFNPGERDSWSLESVCRDELGIGKVFYKGDLGELYRTSPTEFFAYALRDAELLKQLDNKTKMIQLAIVLSRMNGVKVSDVLGAVAPIEMGFMAYCHKRNVVIPDRSVADDANFPGAIVYDTIPGRHGHMMTIDLGSLYPSTAMMLGLSPETMLMKIDAGYEGYVETMKKSDVKLSLTVFDAGKKAGSIKCTARELERDIRENGWTIAANGVIFNGSFGLLSGYMNEGMQKRKEYQKLMREATDPTIISRYDVFQKVVKIHNNSIYGVTGQASFRYFDVNLSAAITMTARIISKFQAQCTQDLLERVA